MSLIYQARAFVLLTAMSISGCMTASGSVPDAIFIEPRIGASYSSIPFGYTLVDIDNPICQSNPLSECSLKNGNIKIYLFGGQIISKEYNVGEMSEFELSENGLPVPRGGSQRYQSLLYDLTGSEPACSTAERNITCTSLLHNVGYGSINVRISITYGANGDVSLLRFSIPDAL